MGKNSKQSKKSPAAKKSTKATKATKAPAKVKAPAKTNGKAKGTTPLGQVVAQPPVVTNKIAIVDACAANECMLPPAPGSGFCAQHTALATASDRIAEVLATASAAVSAAPTVPAAPTAVVAAPAKPTQVDATLGQNAAEAIKALQAKGWTLATIADELDTSPGRVWFWANGKNCRRIADVLSLTFKSPPRPDVVTAPKRGELKVKGATAAKALREKEPRKVDPRQMLLDLRSHINAVLRGTR